MNERLEEEVLEDVVAVSFLSALDVNDVEQLSPHKQRFLIEYINKGTVSAARKAAKVKMATWRRWQADDDFLRVFKTVSSPVAFSYSLRQAMLMRSNMELYKMLQHPNVRVRQWAVELTQNQAAKEEDRAVRADQNALGFAGIAALVSGAIQQLPEADRPRMSRAPFQIVEPESVKVVEADERNDDGASRSGAPDPAEGSGALPE